jgi:hypothetical protein
VHRLVERAVGPIEESAAPERLREQLVTAARLADDQAVTLAQKARTELIVSAVVYGHASTAVVVDRAGVKRQWVNESVKNAVGVGTTHPDHERLAREKRPDLEIPGAVDLLPDAAEAVRFLEAQREAARPLRDRLIVLVAEGEVGTPDLVHLTWLERAMVDRIRARGRRA